VGVFNPLTGEGSGTAHVVSTCLLDTIGKLFERILLTRNLFKIGRCALLRNEQFGFGPKRNTTLQLTLFVERVSRNFGEKRLTGVVFLNVAKAYHTV